MRKGRERFFSKKAKNLTNRHVDFDWEKIILLNMCFDISSRLLRK
jgi:hypothetical protein